MPRKSFHELSSVDFECQAAAIHSCDACHKPPPVAFDIEDKEVKIICGAIIIGLAPRAMPLPLDRVLQGPYPPVPSS